MSFLPSFSIHVVHMPEIVEKLCGMLSILGSSRSDNVMRAGRFDVNKLTTIIKYSNQK
jgi:hypothetical protein